MTLLFLDFETYYDDAYSLTKMAPPNYILDPRYETIGCAVKEGFDGKAHWVDGPDFGAFISRYDPRTTTTVTFNALFDNCILAWQYGFVPARLLCAMRMAVALRGHVLQSASLAEVSRCLGVGVKGTEIENVKGMRRQAIMAAPGNLWQRFQQYAINDVELCAAIFAKLIPEFPHSERRVMDRVLRCAVEPVFQVDTNMLCEHLKDLEETKLRMIALAAGADPDDDSAPLPLEENPEQRRAAFEKFASSLRSNEQFAKHLRARGIEPDLKLSLTDPTRKIFAFAKTDEFMAELLDHEDPVVQALASARLGLRSTIEESRGKRILSIAELPWDRYRDGTPRMYSGGTLPVPLRYSGAHTHRLSGDWKINLQNLPAARGKSKSKLRKSLIAPPGHQVVVGDLSQVECRITAWLCGQRDLLGLFARKEDPYSALGTKVFGYLVDKNVHKIERFIGKRGVLGLGFGCGADKFYNMVLRSARLLGMDMPKLLQVWTRDLCQRTVTIYRDTNRDITRGWYELDLILKTAWLGKTPPRRWKCVLIGHGYVELPNGMKMLYADPTLDPETGELTYRYGKKTFRMYGPKFLENIVQALARIILMNAALRLWDQGLHFKLQAHDELAFLVPDERVAWAKDLLYTELTRRPSWAKDLPLDAEVESGPTYGDAK